MSIFAFMAKNTIIERHKLFYFRKLIEIYILLEYCEIRIDYMIMVLQIELFNYITMKNKLITELSHGNR